MRTLQPDHIEVVGEKKNPWGFFLYRRGVFSPKLGGGGLPGGGGGVGGLFPPVFWGVFITTSGGVAGGGGSALSRGFFSPCLGGFCLPFRGVLLLPVYTENPSALQGVLPH